MRSSGAGPPRARGATCVAGVAAALRDSTRSAMRSRPGRSGGRGSSFAALDRAHDVRPRRAFVGVVLTYVFGRIIGGLPCCCIAYGLALLLVASFFLARRRLQHGRRALGSVPARAAGRPVQRRGRAAREAVGVDLHPRGARAGEARPPGPRPDRAAAGRRARSRTSTRFGARAAACTRSAPSSRSRATRSGSRSVRTRSRRRSSCSSIRASSRCPTVRSRGSSRTRRSVRRCRKPFPTGLEFYGMRDYQPGDDLRRIVWRASARMGKLMVREAEQGITDHITIILDTDRGHHSRDGEYSESFETACQRRRVAGDAPPARRLRDPPRGERRSGDRVRCAATRDSCRCSTRSRASRCTAIRSTAMITRMIDDPRQDAHNILITPHLGDDRRRRSCGSCCRRVCRCSSSRCSGARTPTKP